MNRGGKTEERARGTLVYKPRRKQMEREKAAGAKGSRYDEKKYDRGRKGGWWPKKDLTEDR